jgi:hypothetical protein
MKLTVTIEGLASLPRFDATRLKTELDRELQATAHPLDPTTQRAALARALHRLGGSAR